MVTDCLFFLFFFLSSFFFLLSSFHCQLWASNEVVTEGIAFFFFFPVTVSLLLRQKKKSWGYAKWYCLVLCLTSIVYPLYNILVDSKMYMERYKQDQLHNKTYFKFVPGLIDAAITRHETHKTEDWSSDMTWMLVYFSVAAWSGIMMMSPPWIRSSSISKTRSQGKPLLGLEQVVHRV